MVRQVMLGPDVSEKASRPDAPSKDRNPAASTKGESGDVEARRPDVSKKASRPDAPSKAARKTAASTKCEFGDGEARKPDVSAKASRPRPDVLPQAKRPDVLPQAKRPEVPTKARETEDLTVEWSCSSISGQSDATPPPEEHCPPIRLTINKRRFNSPEIGRVACT